MSLHSIKFRIENAEKSAGVIKGSTQLLAVSKVQPNSKVLNVLNQGHNLFGENKVQE